MSLLRNNHAGCLDKVSTFYKKCEPARLVRQPADCSLKKLKKLTNYFIGFFETE